MYDSDTLDAVRQQVERATDFEFYESRLAAADVEPSDIDSWEAFRDLPFTTAEAQRTISRRNHRPVPCTTRPRW